MEQEPTTRQFYQYNDLAYVYPPDLQKCTTHRNANKIFRKLDISNAQHQKCECCGKHVGEQQDAEVLCYDPLAQFSYLGPGAPLLFVFTQNIMVTLFLLAGIISIQGLISNNSYSFCSDGNCSYQTIFSKLSISQKNLDSGITKLQLVLTLVFTLIWIIVNQFFVYRCRSYENIADQKICTPSDFAIFLLNLPDGTTTQDIEQMLNHTRRMIAKRLESQSLTEQVRQFLEEVRDFQVIEIVIPLKLREYKEKERAEQQRFKRCIKNGTFQQFVKKEIEKPNQLTNFGIVVFEKQITKKLFLKNYDLLQKTKYFFCNWGLQMSNFKVKNQYIPVERASEPEDILWQNLQNSHKSIIIKKLYTFFCGLLVLFIGALVQFALSLWQINNKTANIHTLIAGLSSIIVTFVNYIISVFLEWETCKQGNITRSKYNASLNFKICLFQFINAGIFYTTSNLLASYISQVDFQQVLEVEFAQKITIFMLINAFSEPILNLILDYCEIPNSIQRFLHKHGLIKLTQKECNALHELNDSSIPFKYAYIVKTIWLTCFYAPFVPIVTVISLLGLIFYYITMKVSFRYFYKIPEVISHETNISGLRLSYFAPFMLNLGKIMTTIILQGNFYELQQSQKTIMYVSLVFSIVYGIFPWYDLNKKLFYLQNNSNNNYYQFQQFFEITYDNKMQSKIQKQKRKKNQNYFLLNTHMKRLQSKDIKYTCKSLVRDHLNSSPRKTLEILPTTRCLIP